MRGARAAALLAALLAVGATAWLIGHRLAYPYDLEWLEGATLWHAQRILDGQPLYPPPSLDFVPHPYTPLYPWLLAQLARLFGLSYALGRALSLAAFAGALALGWRFVRAAGGSRGLATVAMALPCAAYVPTGAWIDLVRVDSLWLLLAAAGATHAWSARTHRSGPIVAAALLVAAFFTKQTAAPLMAAVALALAVADRRAALRFLVGLALFGLPPLILLQHATAGWFWFYIYRVHHAHAFSWRAAAYVPGRLALLLLPSLPLFALARPRSPTLLYSAWLAAIGVLLSALGKGTAGAYVNAMLPGVYFAALFAGVAAAQLLAERPRALPWTLLTLTLLTAPGLIGRVVQLLRPSTYHIHQANGFEPADTLPDPAERAFTAALIARLRATPGDVWLPSRPWYAHLATKRPLAGEMAADDLAATPVAVAGLAAALHSRPFAAIVLDDPLAPLLTPLLARSTLERLPAPPATDGHRHPAFWLTPR